MATLPVKLTCRITSNESWRIPKHPSNKLKARNALIKSEPMPMKLQEMQLLSIWYACWILVVLVGDEDKQAWCWCKINKLGDGARPLSLQWV
jgi:hypothetical protein